MSKPETFNKFVGSNVTFMKLLARLYEDVPMPITMENYVSTFKNARNSIIHLYGLVEQ